MPTKSKKYLVLNQRMTSKLLFLEHLKNKNKISQKLK